MERVPVPPSQPKPKLSQKNRVTRQETRRCSFDDSGGESDGARLIYGCSSSSFSSKSPGCSVASGADTCCVSSPDSKSGEHEPNSEVDMALLFQPLTPSFPNRRAKRDLDSRTEFSRKLKTEIGTGNGGSSAVHNTFRELRESLNQSLSHIRELEQHSDTLMTEVRRPLIAL